MQRGRLVLKSGHSEFLNMLNFSFKLFIYIVYQHWCVLCVDL